VGEAKPLMMRIAAAAEELGISQSKMYELIRNNEVRSIHVGPNATRIPYSELEGYVARKIAEQWTGDAA
jgi:excisionase family DNA binding protein